MKEHMMEWNSGLPKSEKIANECSLWMHLAIGSNGIISFEASVYWHSQASDIIPTGDLVSSKTDSFGVMWIAVSSSFDMHLIKMGMTSDFNHWERRCLSWKFNFWYVSRGVSLEVWSEAKVVNRRMPRSENFSPSSLDRSFSLVPSEISSISPDEGSCIRDMMLFIRWTRLKGSNLSLSLAHELMCFNP